MIGLTQVYRLEHCRTGEWYVGVHTCSKKCRPCRYVCSGVIAKRRVLKCRSNWVRQIIHVVESRDTALAIEQFLVGEAYRGGASCDPKCINLRPGGGASHSGYRHSRRANAKKSTYLKQMWADPTFKEKMLLSRSHADHSSSLVARNEANPVRLLSSTGASMLVPRALLASHLLQGATVPEALYLHSDDLQVFVAIKNPHHIISLMGKGFSLGARTRYAKVRVSEALRLCGLTAP